MGGGKVKGAWGRIIPSHEVENGSIELGSGRCDSPRGGGGGGCEGVSSTLTSHFPQAEVIPKCRERGRG